MELALNNGLILKAGKLTKASIGIERGKIKRIAKNPICAQNELDCAGNLIMPGCIDMHVHFRDFNETHKATWQTESRAALHGGVTTVLEMPNNKEFNIRSLKELVKKKKHVAKNSLVNYGLYLGLDEKNLKDLQKVKKHVAGFKLFMAKTTGDFSAANHDFVENAFRAVAKTKKTMVVHAEDPGMIYFYERRHRKRKDHHAVHHDSRPNIVEAAAIAHCIELAKKYRTRTHFTHVSSRQGARLIEQAKRKMKNITADTTPNYLLLNKEMLARRGAFLKVLPPLKSAEDSKALWAALKEGTIDCICTDHAPHLKKEKTKHFREAPSGIPSIDYYLPLIYGNAREHGIQLQQIIELTSKNPAKIFGIKNRGELKIGNFADIVVFNNKKKQKINKKDLKTKVGWSPYEGKRVLGIVEQAVVNGKLVYFDGKFNNEFLGTEIKQ